MNRVVRNKEVSKEKSVSKEISVLETHPKSLLHPVLT